MRFYIIIMGLLSVCSAAFAQQFNIKDYGAINDGRTINTRSIQNTIDACNAKGGGTVYVPSGVFVSGTLHLKSNVNLYLENGAVIKGSKVLKDYETYTIPGYGLNYYGLFYTHQADNVSVTGFGTIDGSNESFHDWSHAKKIDANGTRFTRQKENYRKVEQGIGDGPVVPAAYRPHQMLIFSECKNVHIQNVSLINSPFWTLHIADCDAVNITGINLWSGMLVPNADGIDVTSSSNVVIDHCDIRAGDDALAIVGYDHHFEIPGFSGLKHPCENIIISNCNLQSSSSGIRIGFLDQNTVRNVHVSHVNITNSTRGIGIFLRDEGSLENLSFSDITIETRMHTGDWWGNGEPIHISAVRGKEKVKLGTIKNVEFDNITCTSDNGMLIYGSPESVITDVRFKNIRFNIVNGKLNDVAGGNIDLRGALEEHQQLFASNIPGLLARYVNKLTINGFTLNWAPDINQSYFTNGIEVTDFKDVIIKNFNGTSSPSHKNGYSVALQHGDGAVIESNNYHLDGVLHFKLIKDSQ